MMTPAVVDFTSTCDSAEVLLESFSVSFDCAGIVVVMFTFLSGDSVVVGDGVVVVVEVVAATKAVQLKTVGRLTIGKMTHQYLQNHRKKFFSFMTHP